MTIVTWLVLFPFGVLASIYTIAALYRPLDLWFTIRTEWRRAISGILFWSLVVSVAVWLLDSISRTAFLSGYVGYGTIFTLITVVLKPQFIKVLSKYRRTRVIE